MIPVLGIPIISQPQLLRDCVASIDADVERLVIIDNSPEGGMADELAVPDCVRQTVVHRPLRNLGYAASLNTLVKGFPHESWWMFANADIVFAAGDLARVAEQMDAANGPLLCGIRDFRFFGINYETVRQVGWWDENFHPCYCEDSDYRRRMDVAGVPYLLLQGATGHVGSATIKEQRYAELNSRTYPTNRDYFRRKWGGDISIEVYPTPFNRGGDVGDWRLDIDRLRDNDWT